MPEVIRTPAHLSPLLLAQEFVREDGWKLLAVCILLNRTSGVKQVKPMLADFFERWSSPLEFRDAVEADVKAALKPLGFQNIRYDRLAGMSRDWLDGRRPLRDRLRGVGTYARESYEIWICGYLPPEPHDKELKRYCEWGREETSRVRRAEEVRGGDHLHHHGPGGVQPGVQALERDALL